MKTLGTPGQHPEQNDSNEKAESLQGFSMELSDLKRMVETQPLPTKTEKQRENREQDLQKAQELADTLKDTPTQPQDRENADNAITQTVEKSPYLQQRAQYAKNAEELYASIGGEGYLDQIAHDPRARSLGISHSQFNIS